MSDSMQDIISDVRHSADVDGYTNDQRKFLWSVVERLESARAQGEGEAVADLEESRDVWKAQAMEYKAAYERLSSASAGAVPEVLKGARHHLKNWLEQDLCECEYGCNCGRAQVARTVEDIDAILTAAPTAPAVEGGKPAARIIEKRFGSAAMVDLLRDVPLGADLYTHPHNGEQGGEWIRCEERLPDPDQCVDLWGIIVGGYHHGDESRIENCFYGTDAGQWWKWDNKCESRLYLDFVTATHWTPIPSPPTEQEGHGHE